MIGNITTLTLKGAMYKADTKFDFFKVKDEQKTLNKGALLYGRNGSGKSTIARAFRKLSGEEMPIITSAVLYDSKGDIVDLSDEDKKRIFVFDEDFVSEKIKIQHDHLDTIVIFGEAADLTDKINVAFKKLKDEKSELNRMSKEYKEEEETKNRLLKKICDKLRSDDGWAERDKNIRSHTNKSSVNLDTYSRFLNVKPSKTQSELQADYDVKLNELNNARTGNSEITERVPELMEKYVNYNDETIQTLLSKKIEKPELSEREIKLFELLRSENVDGMIKRKHVFENIDTKECPYCFQPLSDDYRRSLVNNIENILNNELKKHQNELKSVLVDPIDINLQQYEILGSCQKCKDRIAAANSAIEENNKNLNAKIDNPYDAINVNVSSVKLEVEQLFRDLSQLESERLAYNETIRKIGTKEKELSAINDEITYCQIQSLIEVLKDQEDKIKVKGEFLAEKSANIDKATKEIEELEARKKSVNIAVDEINDCLKYIFFSENRFRIETDGIVYKLLSNKKNVKPCDISVGERNIIGLCYFFTSILAGKDKEKAYKDEYIIVIDDPISSYDFENRIGVMSFLKYSLSKFMVGNHNTKAFVMTHEVSSFYDLSKVFDEIMKACSASAGMPPKKAEYGKWELTQDSVITFTQKRQEYTEIIKVIYEYACGNTDKYDMIIGNVMRQALEAYSTFMYKKGIEDVSLDEEILAKLDEPYKKFFKNLMYRLVLHGGSHMENRVKSMQDMDFFSFISDDEKHKTAKFILCFIYKLDEKHLKEHLKEFGEDAKTNLDSWCTDIKSII